MKGKAEIWMKPNGDLVLVEWNPCGCCPNDVMMTWGNGFYDAVSYGSENKSAWTKRLKRKGWERL
jgi:hypothetical protein